MKDMQECEGIKTNKHKKPTTIKKLKTKKPLSNSLIQHPWEVS